MTTTKYRQPPVTLVSQLEQLSFLKDAADGDISEFQKMARKSLLGERGLKALRKIAIREMVISGYRPHQIKLAFVALESPLTVLVDGLATKSGMRAFDLEINEEIKKCENLTPDESREIWIESRQNLLNACQNSLPNVEPSQRKAMIELMEKLQRDVGEARGVIHERAGKRPSTKRPDSPSEPDDDADSAKKTEEDEAKMWEEDFEPDDDTNSVPSEE